MSNPVRKRADEERIHGSGVARLITKDEKPYTYRGTGTEPDPAEVMARFRREHGLPDPRSGEEVPGE